MTDKIAATTTTPSLTPAEVKAIGTVRLRSDWRTLILPSLETRATRQTTAIRKAEQAIMEVSGDWAGQRAAFDSVNAPALAKVAEAAKAFAEAAGKADDASRALNTAMVAGESTPEQLAELRSAQALAFIDRAKASASHDAAKAEITVVDPGTLEEFTARAVETYMAALAMAERIALITAKVQSVTPAKVDEQIVKVWAHAKLGVNLSGITR